MKRVYTPAKKKTILIVDDDRLIIEGCREKFQRHGFRVETASASEDVSQKLSDGAIELVLLDLCLPDLDGLEVLMNLRSNFPAVPVVVFANPYLSSLARQALEAGASKCLTKSDCDPTQLFEQVREIMPPAPTTMAADAQPDLQQEVAGRLLFHAPEILARLRAGHQAFARTEDEEARRTELREMQKHVRWFAAAGFVGLGRISQITNAFEALLIELQAKPKKITPSVIRTMAQAVDTIALLLEQARKSQIDPPSAPKVLIVDDEVISRETISSAVQRARLAGQSLDDSVAAQHLLEQEHFDLIFLDVEMPGLSGFELCKKIREMPTNRSTPVVFVTAHSDFASRAQSALSGGNDFITKPFLAGELVVKALSCLFRENPRAVSIAAPTSIPLPESLAV